MNTQLKGYLIKRAQQAPYTTTNGCVAYNEKENGSSCDGLWNTL